MKEIIVTVDWIGLEEEDKNGIKARDLFETIIENYINTFNALPLKGHKLRHYLSEVAEIVDIIIMEDLVHFILSWDHLVTKKTLPI